MRPSDHALLPLVALMLAGLAGCATNQKTASADDQPTLKSLGGRTIEVAKDKKVEANEEKTIAAYRKFLDVAPKAPQRAEAMRRIGDLEMDIADARSADGKGPANGPDYRAAVKRYEDFLKTYPDDKGNDRVLYQLARAQEQAGELETALKTLDRLVATRPRCTATRRTSAAANCSSRRATTRRPRRPTPPCWRPRSARSTTSARCTCRAGRASSRAGSRRACSPSSACST
jgi:tetratricopeptide (TPR) repeat protein